MSEQYTIYLVNNSASTQVFWLFLAPPKELDVPELKVFANSSTSLAVASYSPGVNTFTIPVQYIVGAGASNNAVGLNTVITSATTNPTALGQGWDVKYENAPPPMGPSMRKSSTACPNGQIQLISNDFNQGANEAQGWFSNMSYGIKTSQGFSGMTWSPSPQQTRTITPKLSFYVAIGSFGSNELADWTDVSNGNAEVSVPGDFQYNKATVTYTKTGGWIVTPGAPSVTNGLLAPANASILHGLVQSHKLLSAAHAQLVDTTMGACDSATAAKVLADRRSLAAGATQNDKLVGVKWGTGSSADAAGNDLLSGTLSVSTALIAAFTTFVLSGVRFSISYAPAGGTTVSFSYSGTESVEYIKSLFSPGSILHFFTS